MADPIQTARIVEAMARASEPSDWRIIDAHIHPGAVDPDCRAIDMRDKSLARAQAALSTAYPMIREEMAKLCDAEAAERKRRYHSGDPNYGEPMAQAHKMVTASHLATAIRATELAKGEE